MKTREIRMLPAVPTGLGAAGGSIPALKRRAISIDAYGIAWTLDNLPYGL